jgi:hypothetical protein
MAAPILWSGRRLRNMRRMISNRDTRAIFTGPEAL